MAQLMYGTGMCLMERIQLRVKDVDFGYCQATFGVAHHYPLSPDPSPASGRGEKYAAQGSEHDDDLCARSQQEQPRGRSQLDGMASGRSRD